MKQDVRVLIIEDDEEYVSSWRRDIKEYNASQGYKVSFLATFANNKSNSICQLKNKHFDCAVTDLRMPETDDSTDTLIPLGNSIAEHILNEIGIPTIVYSGYPEEISETVKNSPIATLEKSGDGTIEVLHKLESLCELIAAMSDMRAIINRETSRLFAKSIWPRWKDVWCSEVSTTELSSFITRQTVSHLANALSLPEDTFHPQEFYHKPSLGGNRLGTGDIIEWNDCHYVIVTPPCNMANNNYPDNILLVLCENLDMDGIQNKLQGNAKNIKSAKREIRDLATQGHHVASHFLPELDGKGPWTVNFKELLTISKNSVPQLLENRIATITPSFVPNLLQRYSAYLGRVGQPALNLEFLAEQFKVDA